MWHINKNVAKQNQIRNFYNLMAVPALPYGSETSVMNQKDYGSLTAAEMAYSPYSCISTRH